MDIGAAIAGLRNARGMSQQTLADSLSVSRELVSKWESGSRRPDYPMIERIAEIFEVDPDLIADKNGIIFEELSECVRGCDDISEERLSELVGRFLKSNNQKESGMFIQRYYYLKNTDEISRIFGVRENQVRSLLSRTRKKLRRYVKENQA